MSAMTWTWLLSWRAALGRDFLAWPSLRDGIATSLVDAHRSHGRRLMTFAILGSEVHALSALSGEEEPSALARVIGAALTRHVRRAHPVASPVMAAACRATLVEGEGAVRREIRHLHWRADVNSTDRPPQQLACALTRLLLADQAPNGFDPEPLLAAFGDDGRAGRLAMEGFLAQQPSRHEARTWELVRGMELIARPGLMSRAGAMPAHPEAAELLAAVGDEGVDGVLQLIEQWATRRLGLPPASAIASLRGRVGTRARALVAAVAVNSGVCSAAYVARRYGRAKATLCAQLAALHRCPTDSWLSRTPAARIIETARQSALGDEDEDASSVQVAGSGGSIRSAPGFRPDIALAVAGASESGRLLLDEHPAVMGGIFAVDGSGPRALTARTFDRTD